MPGISTSYRRGLAAYRQVWNRPAMARYFWMRSATCRLAMQAKLLRVLEQGEVERIGGDKPTKVNVRVVVATHRQLEEQVNQGSFRQDLFHRIFVFPIVLPPLRERPEDIPALAAHFAEQIVKQNNWKEITFSLEALQALQAHSWPGNIRELRNVVERLLLFAEGDTVTPATVQAALPMQAADSGGTQEPPAGLELTDDPRLEVRRRCPWLRRPGGSAGSASSAGVSGACSSAVFDRTAPTTIVLKRAADPTYVAASSQNASGTRGRARPRTVRRADTRRRLPSSRRPTSPSWPSTARRP